MRSHVSGHGNEMLVWLLPVAEVVVSQVVV